MNRTQHRIAGLKLLNEVPTLSHKEAGFLGHVAVATELTPRQREWLGKILARNGMPALSDGDVS